MANQMQRWMPIVLIGGVLWFLSRDGFLTRANGNGNGNGNGVVSGNGSNIPAGNNGGGGPANIGGTIGGIGMYNKQNELGLYAHKLERKDGDMVEVSVEWNQGTTDFLGNATAWPSRILAELGHSTNWGTQWSDMTDLLGSGGYGVETLTGASSGAHTSTIAMTMGPEPNPPKNWDVRVRLEMQGTTATGTPDGIWTEIATESHTDAVRSIASTGYSNVGGWIGEIGVYPYGGSSYGAGAYGGPGQGDYGYFSNTPAARMGNNNMRKLGMSQQRSPWGTVGHPDVRQWPRSDRNPNLPGVQIRVRQGSMTAGSRLGPGRRMSAV